MENRRDSGGEFRLVGSLRDAFVSTHRSTSWRTNMCRWRNTVILCALLNANSVLGQSTGEQEATPNPAAHPTPWSQLNSDRPSEVKRRLAQRAIAEYNG